jgi:hypothetical protein
MAGILLRSRPQACPVRAAVGTDADQVESLPAFPGLRCRVVLEQDKRGPFLRARAAQMCSVDSVIPEAVLVSVTAARWPGSGSAVSHTRRWATPTLVAPAG